MNAATLGALSRYQSQHDFSPQDALVYASVIAHLKQVAPPESCFLNRDSKDFDDPVIVEELKDHACTLVPRFDNGLARLLSQLRTGGS